MPYLHMQRAGKVKRAYLEMYPRDIDDRIIMCERCTELNERGSRINKESVDMIERVCGYDRKILWVCDRKSTPWLCGLGIVDIWYADVGVVVGSWILGHVSKLDGLVVGPSRKVGGQFRLSKRTTHSLTILFASHQQEQNPRV